MIKIEVFFILYFIKFWIEDYPRPPRLEPPLLPPEPRDDPELGLEKEGLETEGLEAGLLLFTLGLEDEGLEFTERFGLDERLETPGLLKDELERLPTVDLFLEYTPGLP